MMSSTTPPFVWFLLLDSTTGKPYKGTSADYVSLPSTAVIAQFRDAIIEKFVQQKSSVLAGFASSQLDVYKNKAAFDKPPSRMERKSHSSKKTLSLMALERQRRKPSLSPSHPQEAPIEAPPEKSRIPIENNDG